MSLSESLIIICRKMPICFTEIMRKPRSQRKQFLQWKNKVRCLPNCSNILSHSSKMKCFKCLKFNFLLRMRAKMRPGVPTTICGTIVFNVSSSFWIGRPPKKTATFNAGIYLEKRSYSLLIWKANSRVWHITKTYVWFSVGSNCCSVAKTNTAVLPIPEQNQDKQNFNIFRSWKKTEESFFFKKIIKCWNLPDLAWHKMSIPKTAWGIHSCWTKSNNNKKIKFKI